MISDLSFIESAGYVCSILGNGGEEAFVVIASGGQARQISFAIVTTAIDQGPTKAILDNKDVPYEDFLKVIRRELMRWSKSGIKPTEAEKPGLEQEVEIMARKIVHHFIPDTTA